MHHYISLRFASVSLSVTQSPPKPMGEIVAGDVTSCGCKKQNKTKQKNISVHHSTDFLLIEPILVIMKIEFRLSRR